MYSGGNGEKIHKVEIAGRMCEFKGKGDKIGEDHTVACEGAAKPQYTIPEVLRIAEQATGKKLKSLIGTSYRQLARNVNRYLPNAKLVMGLIEPPPLTLEKAIAERAILPFSRPVELEVTSGGKTAKIIVAPKYLVHKDKKDEVALLKRDYTLVRHPKIHGYLIAIEMRHFNQQIHTKKDFLKEFRALRV